VLVVVGVHAGKFIAERQTRNLADACRRLGVHHPIVNDRQFRTWRAYAVQAWPTLTFLDPHGRVVAQRAGENPLDALVEFTGRLVDSHLKEASLVRGPLALARQPAETPTGLLRYPGKVLATDDGRLFVADSGHDRILELRVAPAGPGAVAEPSVRARVVRVFGSGEPGFQDGSGEEARFCEPQGMALLGDSLYVADRANHAVRRVDLASGRVETVAGTGRLGGAMRAGVARRTDLRSPWDVCAIGPGTAADGALFVAMAGAHQIWRLELAAGEIHPHVGSGVEEVHDALLAEAALAQPTGLTIANGRIWFADSETSAVRWAGLDPGGRVGTLVGTGLFDFGDRDGTGDEARLQHCLGVAWLDGALFVADTYNGKVKRVDPATRSCVTWAGGADGSPALHEPGGISAGAGSLWVADTGHHRIVRYDPATARGEVVEISDRRRMRAVDGMQSR
jgi:sugar lactone lactonase YvrE